ncbi:STAS/SEC14 domain-containing protein [Vibrio sp. SCSIO 43137]|uniref:STAS/SEC14 domain-containing protein n=1 Tax=Vibrio sp. SCSIO 43137 TaxID=3021011 RepID=UPI002308053C|nr:STAS/SEC14 domain-containing protein [Vibrio sp. SCSIO 43137]WCE28908.1 STAS/SEC14 domain-containing protein [Vibrio sp. SCSIO 43137]
MKILTSENPSVFAVEINEKVGIEQENQMLERVESILQKQDKIRVLVVLGEEAGWTVEAGLKDLKWVLSNLSRLDKIAVVADKKIITWLVEADAVFAKMIGIGEKAFATSEIEKAWQWIED